MLKVEMERLMLLKQQQNKKQNPRKSGMLISNDTPPPKKKKRRGYGLLKMASPVEDLSLTSLPVEYKPQ